MSEEAPTEMSQEALNERYYEKVLRPEAAEQRRRGLGAAPRIPFEEFEAARRDPKVHAAIARALAEGEALERERQQQ